jgi:lipid II:glycine glycyltransferase (peptidoglycan interpeptide bridge formation enzyme)
VVLKEISIEEYASLAVQHVGVFGSKEWLSIYNKITCVGIFANEARLIGGFYYMKTKKFGLDFIKPPPYSPHCGLFFTNESKNQSSKNNTTKEILSDVCNYISGQKAGINVLSFPSQITDLQVFFWKKFKVVPNYTYRIDLSKTIEEIKTNFDSKNRNKINKAAKEGVIVEENSLTGEQLFEFFNSTLSSTGANVYSEVLKNILTGFPNATNSFSLTAKHDNKVIGNVFCVYDKVNCYYILGGVHKDSGVAGVNNLLLQHSIEKAKELGCKFYDFEGSMVKGVEVFFRGFGGQLVPYYTVNKANLFIEMLLKLKKRETF